ncbi:mutarotase [Flavobacterium sp.]|uniref:2'-5' RNA ligase family protein n=1 Tax=Flavobacterium sp. TaxID=239 RepID=UPI0012011C4D|nr:mutarotase [Flavobacterium sp.]RZJ70575.1 MAG: mutarotase [Flavobacterium sp.]
MTDLQSRYDEMFESAIGRIEYGVISVDRKIADDDRFGITVVLRPDAPTRAQVSAFLANLKTIDPKQYYYPDSDLHVTVLSLISGRSGFELSEINLSEYVKIVRKSLENVSAFEMELKGVTASAEAILIQGFPSGGTLETIRENLRMNFKKSELFQTIDARYKIFTAHITAARFASELQNSSEFARVVSSYREQHFGKFKVERIELVCNDWYQKAQKTTSIADFLLG